MPMQCCVFVCSHGADGSQINNSAIVAPCLFNAPANGSISGFPLGRVTKVRSGLNGVLGPTATATAAVSGVRSNATGSSMSVRLVQVRMMTRR